MKKFALLLFCMVFVSANVGFAWMGETEDDAKKITNKQVMAKMFKGKAALGKKLTSGTATDEEKELAVKYITALSKNQPKKGGQESWAKKTAALLKATKAIHEGTEGAAKQFAAASNCKSCHNLHK